MYAVSPGTVDEHVTAIVPVPSGVVLIAVVVKPAGLVGSGAPVWQRDVDVLGWGLLRPVRLLQALRPREVLSRT